MTTAGQLGQVGLSGGTQPAAGGVSATARPPLARRPVVSPALALREEMSDSWRLLGVSLGAASAVAALLYLFASVFG